MATTPDDLNAILNANQALRELHESGAFSGSRTIIVDDTDIEIPPVPGTTIVLYTGLTTSRFVLLPLASSPPMTVLVKDVNGLADSTADPPREIVLSRAGDDMIIGSENILRTRNGDGFVLSVTNDRDTTWTEISDLLGETWLAEILTALGICGAITPPSGGSVVDVQARAAIAAMIVQFSDFT